MTRFCVICSRTGLGGRWRSNARWICVKLHAIAGTTNSLNDMCRCDDIE